MSVRSQIAILLFAVCLVAGRFGLDRWGIDIGIMGEPRWWLLGILIGLLAVSPVRVEWTRRLTLYFSALLLYVTYVIVSTLWTPDAIQAVQQIEDLPLLLLLLATVPFVFGEAPIKGAEFFLEISFFISFAFALIGLVGGSSGAENRLSVMGGGPNVYARIMAVGVFAAMYLWTKRGRFYWLLPIPFMAAAAVLSGSRGGVISLMAGVGILLLATQRPSRLLKFVAVILILSAVPAYLYSEKLDDIITKRFMSTYQNQNYGAREFIYPSAIRVFEKHLFFGAGADGFRQEGGAGEFYAHNLFLEAAAEGGLLGLILLMLVLLQSPLPFARKMPLEGRFVAGTGIALFLAQMTSGTYYDARQMWTAGVLGVMLLNQEPAQYVVVKRRAITVSAAPMR